MTLLRFADWKPPSYKHIWSSDRITLTRLSQISVKLYSNQQMLQKIRGDKARRSRLDSIHQKHFKLYLTSTVIWKITDNSISRFTIKITLCQNYQMEWWYVQALVKNELVHQVSILIGFTEYGARNTYQKLVWIADFYRTTGSVRSTNSLEDARSLAKSWLRLLNKVLGTSERQDDKI